MKRVRAFFSRLFGPTYLKNEITVLERELSSRSATILVLNEEISSQKRILRRVYVEQAELRVAIAKARHDVARKEQDVARFRREWNKIADAVNAKGGWTFIERGVLPEKAASAFTQDEIRTLIRLCHPDKHAGSESAGRITQKLLQLRNK